MSNKNIRDGDFLRNERGAVFASLGSEKSKSYAVIVQCGHCGKGYYIPIMFTTNSENIKDAIEDIKMTPRVKREKNDCVIDAFEITALEKFIIDAINDHDEYLTGFLEIDSPRLIERRVQSKSKISELLQTGKQDIKTSDKFHYYFVLERFVSPRLVGSDLVIPNKINKNELLKEFFKCATIRYGFKRNSPFFPMLYYMQYGENNDLDIKFENDVISYEFARKREEHPLKENLLCFVDRFGVNESPKEETWHIIEDDGNPTNRESQISKFEKRLQKTKMKNSVPKQPGDE